VVGCCEHGDDPSVFTKGDVFFDNLRGCWFSNGTLLHGVRYLRVKVNFGYLYSSMG
jgi:hypothetical protein